jgi:hypothetical protein
MTTLDKGTRVQITAGATFVTADGTNEAVPAWQIGATGTVFDIDGDNTVVRYDVDSIPEDKRAPEFLVELFGGDEGLYDFLVGSDSLTVLDEA